MTSRLHRTNGKMKSVPPGLTSLESLEEFIATNRLNYDCIAVNGSVPGVIVINYDKQKAITIIFFGDCESRQINPDELQNILG